MRYSIADNLSIEKSELKKLKKFVKQFNAVENIIGKRQEEEELRQRIVNFVSPYNNVIVSGHGHIHPIE